MKLVLEILFYDHRTINKLKFKILYMKHKTISSKVISNNINEVNSKKLKI